jgi:hypothetical protein
MFWVSIAAASAALVAQADEANFAYVDCMFTAVREASADTGNGALEQLIVETCASQRDRLHELLVEVRVQNGDSPEQAEATWRQLEADGLASVLRAREQAQRLN